MLKIGTLLVFIGISTFAMGLAYRLRGTDAEVSEERRAELASILISSEATGLVGILIGLWSGAVLQQRSSAATKATSRWPELDLDSV
ncbi:MAG TPA: hypothetical protein VKB09_00915 [Thermomicrobiales bacterium]|nr:hypothetical protein [Thermomicrobiales bacterium]